MSSQISAHCVLFVLCLVTIKSETTPNSDDSEYKVIQKVINECSINTNKFVCFANKAAVIVERAMDWNVPLLDGVFLTKNSNYVLNKTQFRSIGNGIERLSSAVSEFLDSHTLTLKLAQTEQEKEEGRGSNQAGKKAKKILPYIALGLLGTIGVTVPLVMKTFAVIAGKALIASKIALLIIGSIMLKHLFEKHDSHSSFKVLTHTEDHHDEHGGDDFDRRINSSAYKFLNSNAVQ